MWPPVDPEIGKSQSAPIRGVEHAGVIDVIAYNEKNGEVTLGMVEPRPWDGSDARLFQLQEKVNSYLAFALDGEMHEAYPDLAHKPLRIELLCLAPPDAATLHLLELVRAQIAFQGIRLEVRVEKEGV